MPKNGKHKNDRGKKSTSNPNLEFIDWETCTNEEQLEKIIQKKLEQVYREALCTLVYKGFDEDVALNGLLERGYCVGECDCLTNVVQNSSEFLTGKSVESEQEDRPQPFQNLELLVDFNLHFLMYILQKYRPNLNRISIRRCILMSDLNLNRAITMDNDDGTFDIREMLSDLNLDDEDGDKDGFLALEIREMLDNLNVLDESVVSEDMKDKMIAGLKKPMDDLKPLLEERIRWASKKVAQARRNQPLTIKIVQEKFQQLQYTTESMLAKWESELSSANIGLAYLEGTIKRLEMEKEEIKAEISASKLIESEAKQKCFEVSKKERKKLKLQEEIKLEKKKISNWEQHLAENEAAIIRAQVNLREVMEARNAAIAELFKICKMALHKWNGKLEALKIPINAQMNVLGEPITTSFKKLLKNSLTKVLHFTSLREARDKNMN